MMKCLASVLILSSSMGAANIVPSCDSKQTCVWANATQMVVQDAVSILRQEVAADFAQKFQDDLAYKFQDDRDKGLVAAPSMAHLQTVVQRALNAMGNQSRGEEIAAKFIGQVKSAVTTARNQLGLYPPGVKVAGHAQWGLPCEAGSCRAGMCNRAILACGAVCAVGCVFGVCPVCLTCLATYVGCCECASQDFGFACSSCF